MTNTEKKREIFPPKSQGIFLIQHMALAPITTPIVALYSLFSSGSIIGSNDLLIFLIAFFLPLFLVGFAMVYIPSLYRTRLIFDSEKKILYKVKKGAKTEKFDLTIIKSILSKIMNTPPARKYVLILKDAEENFKILFNEDNPSMPFGMRRWETFGSKLSELTGLPLEKEFWEEDFNGKLSLIQREDRVASKKKGLLILLIPLFLSFLGAVGYRIINTNEAFLLIGLSVVFINMIFSIIYTFLHRKKIGDWASNGFTLIIVIFTLLIPYTMFYIFFVFLLKGFNPPESFSLVGIVNRLFDPAQG